MKSPQQIKAQIAKNKALQAKSRHEESVATIASVKEEIHVLNELLNGKEQFDSALLVEQIKSLVESINITEEVKKISDAINNSKPAEFHVDLTSVIEAIESNKSVVNVDLSNLEKAILEVQQRVSQESVVDQAPEKYQPIRRVIKVGKRLLYDDSVGSSSSGGVDISSLATSLKQEETITAIGNILTDEELRATPLEVNLPTDTYSAIAVDATLSGNNTVVSITNTARLYYVSLSANGANSSDVTAIVKIGTSEKFKVSLKAGSIFARNIGAGRRYLTGSSGDDIIVNLSAAQTVHVSVEYEDV